MTYNIEKLTDYCTQALMKTGVTEEHARQTADCLVNTDMRGVHSHGCVRMEGYVECLLSGGVRSGFVPKVVHEGPTYALVDADQGLGIPASVFATDIAIKKAKEHGMAIVNVKNSHHHGACGYYSIECTRHGLISLAMSTGGAIMSVTGSAHRSIGNNPFSFAMPAGKYDNVCYDIATSQVAAGKISIAAAEDREIPLGWLLDGEGNPTTNPKLYAQENGALVPFGGPSGDHKGYGLSVMVESMAGILSGANMLLEIDSWNKNPEKGGGTGHCIIAISPEHLNPELDLVERAETMIETLISSKKAPGVDRIYFPGEKENDREALALKQGVTLPAATEYALTRMAALLDMTFDPEQLKQD